VTSAIAPTLGQGDWVFEPVPEWGELPHDVVLGDCAGVAVDSHDRVVLFNRGETPVVILDRDGAVVTTWGKGLFTNPHGAMFGPDDTLYLTDNGDHTVRRFTADGDMLLEIGQPGIAAPFLSNRPFHRCTHSTLTPLGDILVSDGYGNAAVHRFSPSGELLATFGEPGVGPGQFNVPHNIACDAQGRIYVADRENDRVQIFEADGTFRSQIVNMHRPSGMAITRDAEPSVIVGEMASYLAVNKGWPNIGVSVTVFAGDGTLLSRIRRDDSPLGQEPGQWMSPHSIALDSEGSMYVGEVGSNDWAALFGDEPRPAAVRGFQKLRRVAR
jgi:DNA-binding beta-propeller fold protein YncE